MASISLGALTVEQKKYEARALRFEYRQGEIAELLDVPKRTIREWLVGMKLPAISQIVQQALRSAETCSCEHPAADPRTDALCRRSETCFWCGKPPRHATRPHVVIRAGEAQ